MEPASQRTIHARDGRLRIAGGRQWVAIAGAWMLYCLGKIALIQFAPSHGMTWSWYSTAALTLSIGLFWTLATPLVFALAARFRPDRVGLARALSVHVSAACVAALGAGLTRHGTLMLMFPTETPSFIVPFLGLLDYQLITYAMLAVIGTALDRYREYTVSRTRSLMLLTQLAEARLQFLQRQLQPHFLFNALNTVAELARESPVVARRTLLDLARLLHSAIDHADDPEVTLREELVTLEPFLQIQRLRFSDSLDIGLDVEPDTFGAHVPPMLLQPLIENAIRHGRAGRGERGTVMIVARRVGDRLVLRVEDDGARFHDSSASLALPARAGHGIGLRNTTERLAQLYGKDHRFQLRLEYDDTTIAELDLPFRATPSHPSTRDSARPARLERSRLDPSFEELVATVPLSDQPRAPVDYTDTPTDSDTTSPPRLSARAWGAILAGWTFAAAYWMAQSYVMDRVAGKADVPWNVGIIDLVSSIIWAGLTPIVLWLARAVRIRRGRMRWAIAFHLVAALVVAVVHLWVCFSVGVADRPLLLAVNVNPFMLDLCIYFALLAWSHARDFTVWYEERGVCAARTETAIARARVDASAIALHTPFLLHALNAAAALALVSSTRTEQVVERLADLLRAVLQTAGQGAHTVLDELLLLERFLDVHHELTGAQTLVRVSIDGQALKASMPPGVGNAVIENILGRAVAAAESPLCVDVEPAGPGRAREIVFRVSLPTNAVAFNSSVGQAG
ncbi:MAG: histidine kinase internal region [Gemmatimonadetes bacterium]|nr:histidine kinase internal region [Gemmatimonadota bacterium]